VQEEKMTNNNERKSVIRILIICLSFIVAISCTVGSNSDGNDWNTDAGDDQIELIEPGEVEEFGDGSIPNSFPAGVISDQEELHPSEALMRVLWALCWQVEQIDSTWGPRDQIIDTALRAIVALASSNTSMSRTSGNVCPFVYIYDLIDLIFAYHPPHEYSSLWTPVVELVPVLESLMGCTSENVTYQGAQTTLGAILNIFAGHHSHIVELYNSNIVQFAQDLRAKFSMWINTRRLGEGGFYAHSLKVEDEALTNGNKYYGYLVQLCFYYSQTSDCKQFRFIQFIKRKDETIIDENNRVSYGGRKWRIDKEIPADIASTLDAGQRAEWIKTHPCYNHQDNIAANPAENKRYPRILMKDHPGTEVSTPPDLKTVITWKFKTYIVCCKDDFKVIGHVEWGFKVEFPGNGAKGTVTVFTKDPDDPTRTYPSVNVGSDSFITSELADWIADTNRDCSTN
jgi:hypothetical protein